MRSPSAPFTATFATAGIGLVIVLGILVTTGISDPADTAIISAVRAPALSGLLSPLLQVTELGSTWAVTAVAILTLVLAVVIGPWRHGVAGAVTITAASILNASIKLAVARERPALLEPLVEERGFSFPSGHSALGMVAYGILAVVIARSRLPRAARVVLIAALVLLVLLIGTSRVWLGVHYPTDVLAGWTAGAVIVAGYAFVTRGVTREPSELAVDAPSAPVSLRPDGGDTHDHFRGRDQDAPLRDR